MECMKEHGFEVIFVDLTPGKEQVELAPHDRPLEEVIAATEECERRAKEGESGVQISGDDLEDDVDAVAAVEENGGVVVLLLQDGQVSSAAAGTANPAGDQLGMDSAFNIASVTKTYTAAVVYRLEDQDLVSTAEPLSTYLPSSGFGDHVTLDALLSHTSGIPDYADNPDYLADVLADPDRVFTPAELLDYAASLPSTPVGAFDYSNTGFVLLGQMIEQVTGQPLPAVMSEEIFDPLGLTRTTVVDPPGFRPDLVSAWADPEALGLPPMSDLPVLPFPAALSGCQADCGIVTTAEELQTFFDALFDGAIVSEGALARMMQPGPDPSEARGLSIYEDSDGHKTYGHGGGGAGYTARVAVDPQSGDIAVFLANNDALEVDGLFEAYRP